VEQFVGMKRVLVEEERELVQNLEVRFNVHYQQMVLVVYGGRIVKRKVIDPLTTLSELVEIIAPYVLESVPVMNSEKDAVEVMSRNKKLVVPSLVFLSWKAKTAPVFVRRLAKVFENRLGFAYLNMRKCEIEGLRRMQAPSIVLMNDNEYLSLFEASAISSDISAMEKKLLRFYQSYFPLVTMDLFEVNCSNQQGSVCIFAVSSQFSLYQHIISKGNPISRIYSGTATQKAERIV
jgi:hypothetical protein